MKKRIITAALEYIAFTAMVTVIIIMLLVQLPA